MNKPLQKILVVDDDEAVLFAHQEVLSDLGFDVDTAQTLEEALELINRNIFSIIVTDLNLSNSPDYEGFKIISKAKRCSTTNTIIVVSAYGDDSVKEEALNAGADYFLEKPVSSEKLKKFLEEKGVVNVL